MVNCLEGWFLECNSNLIPGSKWVRKSSKWIDLRWNPTSTKKWNVGVQRSVWTVFDIGHFTFMDDCTNVQKVSNNSDSRWYYSVRCTKQNIRVIVKGFEYLATEKFTNSPHAGFLQNWWRQYVVWKTIVLKKSKTSLRSSREKYYRHLFQNQSPIFNICLFYFWGGNWILDIRLSPSEWR